MIKVSVLYPNGDGSTFDHDYYLEHHMPMAAEVLGDALKGFAVDRGLSGVGPGEPPAYLAIGHLMFDSIEDFQSAFGPSAERIQADVPNYTNTTPTIQISEVRA